MAKNSKHKTMQQMCKLRLQTKPPIVMKNKEKEAARRICREKVSLCENGYSSY